MPLHDGHGAGEAGLDRHQLSFRSATAPAAARVNADFRRGEID
jgi:hypothetical protein